jgi:hypothetical protein
MLLCRIVEGEFFGATRADLIDKFNFESVVVSVTQVAANAAW